MVLPWASAPPRGRTAQDFAHRALFRPRRWRWRSGKKRTPSRGGSSKRPRRAARTSPTECSALCTTKRFSIRPDVQADGERRLNKARSRARENRMTGFHPQKEQGQAEGRARAVAFGVRAVAEVRPEVKQPEDERQAAGVVNAQDGGGRGRAAGGTPRRAGRARERLFSLGAFEPKGRAVLMGGKRTDGRLFRFVSGPGFCRRGWSGRVCRRRRVGRS